MHQRLSQGDASVRLRTPLPDDFAGLASLRRDTAAQDLLLTVPAATDDSAVRDWIERRSSEPGGVFRIIADETSGQMAGFVQVTGVHRRNATGYGGIALLPEWRGQGLGRPALQALIDLAGNELRLSKLMAEIRQDNTSSLKLHLSLSYRTVGLLERHFLDCGGEYHDVVLVERLLAGANP